MNVPLLRKALEHVEQHPEEWDQADWVQPCGTKYCFAGHALSMLGHEVSVVQDKRDGARDIFLDGRQQYGKDMIHAGADALGLNFLQAEELFNGRNSLTRLRELCEKYAGEAL